MLKWMEEWEIRSGSNKDEINERFKCQLKCVTTQWSAFFLEKLTGSQLVKKFPSCHGSRRFIIAFSRARYLSLPWARWSQSISPSHAMKIHFSIIPVISPSKPWPSKSSPSSGFVTKTLYVPLPSPIHWNVIGANRKSVNIETKRSCTSVITEVWSLDGWNCNRKIDWLPSFHETKHITDIRYVSDTHRMGLSADYCRRLYYV